VRNIFDNNRQSDTVAAVKEILKHHSDTKQIQDTPNSV